MFRSFRTDGRGNVALTFAMLIPVLFLIAGGAVDFWRRNAVDSSIQEALDAAALLAARETGRSDSERRQLAVEFFEANLVSGGIGISATPNFQFTSNSVLASVSYEMPTSLLKVVNLPSLTVTNLTEAVSPGLGQAELVMVLDYSSSMDDKYDEMRDAALEFVDILSNGGANPDIKFGLVPFAREVYATLDGEYVLGGTAGIPWSNCTRDRHHPYNITDETPLFGVDDSKWGRTDGDDTIDPDEYDECGNYPANNLEIQPLTNDHAVTEAKLMAMTPHEGTNIAVGVEFATHILSPNPPWTEGDLYGATTNKFMLVLSDGRHNKDGFGPGASNNEAQARHNMSDNCDAMKSKGVVIMTVAYDLDDDEGKAELEACASSSQYYLEGDESDILEQFQGLANTLLATEIYLKQ